MRIGYAIVLAASLAGTAWAGEAKVSGLHNCCPRCTQGIKASLEKAGATKIDVKGNDVSFTADNTQKAVDALYEAGYAGKIEGAKLPAVQGGKADKLAVIKLEGIHNCCGSCTTGIQNALKDIGTSDAAPNKTVLTVTPKSPTTAAAVIEALRAAGYNARLAK